MSNSTLVSYKKLSPNHSGTRTHSIDRITPHCVVGQLSCESICSCFTNPNVRASCNYGIGKDGRISLCVEEKNRSWCSSSSANDQRAVTIECASERTEPYAMNSKVYDSLVHLCTDICKRNGKKKLLWFPDKKTALSYEPKPDEMVLTVHRWFANKSCPGDWLYFRLGDVAEKVNVALGSSKRSWYRVRKSWKETKSQIGAFQHLSKAKACADKNPGYFVFDEKGKVVYPEKMPFLVKVATKGLNIRKGPGSNYEKTGKYLDKGVFTIVEVKDRWGKLKSGVGWINLDDVQKK